MGGCSAYLHQNVRGDLMPSSIIRSDSEGIELIRELARSYWYSAVLRAGIKLGAFSLLDGGPLTPD